MITPAQLPRDIRPHSILEPIHGLVRLTEAEFAVLNHPLFRRLLKIKQNGLLYLVFPSATHNRFEHSLGAMYVADAMLEQVWLNSAVASRKGSIVGFDESRTNVAIDFSGVPEDTMRWVVRVTRLAALVHDLGHGPLSHTFDSFTLYRDNLGALLQGGAIPLMASSAEKLQAWERRGAPGSVEYDRVPHEVMSCVFFAHVWSELLMSDCRGAALNEADAAQLPLAVAACILGNSDLGDDALSTERKAWLPFIHDLIASAPADADRMDYLERDSRSLGVTYGLFDRNRIMKSFLCFRRGDGEAKEYRLGVKRSGIPAMENLVQARFELFVQVYYHKTNQAISKMLGEIARQAHQAKVRLFEVNTANPTASWLNIVERYIDLSDDHFIRVLRGKDFAYTTLPSDAIALATAIDERRLWKRVYEGDERGARYVFEGLKRSALPDKSQDDIVFDVSKPKATKELDKGAILLVKDEHGVYAPLLELSWYESSIIIEALRRAEGNIGRVYAKALALETRAFSELVRTARRLGHRYDVERLRFRKLEKEEEERLRRESSARLDASLASISQ